MKTFILSDESVNNYGFWLPLSGAQLDQFKKNPVMLWMHNRAWRGVKDEILPIGYWDNIRVENGKLLADAVFDESDEFAMSIYDKVENNVLRMASVGIRVIETSKDPKWIKPGQTTETPTKWALREGSIVDIGSNNNALSLVFYDENDQMINLADGKATLPLRLLEDKTNNSNSIEMKKLSQLLQLADGASEEQLADAIQAIQTENKNLKDAKIAAEQKLSDYEAKDKTARTNEAKSLLDAAVADGRIDADGRKTWETLFEKDHLSAQATLAAIPKRSSVASQLGDGKQKPGELETLSKLSFDELDKQGKLRLVKEKYADLYEEKFEAKFGKKPNK